MKRALIISAHPNSLSFNMELAAAAKNQLESQGIHVDWLDLYEMDFPDPSCMKDFLLEFSRENFDYKETQRAANKANTFSSNIRHSQQLLAQTDLVIFQFPLWWFSMPAIMKNWIEKCFTFDFAYNGRERRWFSNGPFKGKLAMLSFTTSGSQSIYTDQGINGDISNILWPIHNGILNFTGFTVLPPFIAWGSDTSQRNNRKLYVDAFRLRIENILDTQPIVFPTLEMFDDNYIFKSKEEI